MVGAPVDFRGAGVGTITAPVDGAGVGKSIQSVVDDESQPHHTKNVEAG